MSWAELSARTRGRLTRAVLERDGYRCRLGYPKVCVGRADCADHIRSRELGGDGLDNLQAACTPCNLHKGKPGRTDPEPRPSRWT